MHLHSGRLVTSSEEQSNSKSESSSKSQSSPQSRLNMDPPPQDELRQAIAELTARLGHLEAMYDEANAQNGKNNNRHGPHLRQDHRDNKDNSAKHIKVEALIFDGVRNPQVYNDWVREMEHFFFEWYELSEDKNVRFAKMKFVGRAKLHWDSVVNHLRKTRQPLITLWEDMKAKLNEKYFPVSHPGNLLDQWHDLRQDNSDIDDEIHDPWAAIKLFGPTSDSGTDGQTKFATEGCFLESEFGFGNRKVKISNHKLTRKNVTGDCRDLVQGDAEGLDSDGN
ncbi:hypothetical protein SO802_031021 [Lithocarpus litseifolius]|uniref:Retrotransposon gag domain-containing protein n=1 Tax=Lithocarpus litseifolius TaxID=425828 RepID=A0AAW2BPV9_9ROSI